CSPVATWWMLRAPRIATACREPVVSATVAPPSVPQRRALSAPPAARPAPAPPASATGAPAAPVQRSPVPVPAWPLRSRQWNAASIETTKKGLEDANRQLAEQKQLASRLTLEKEALQNRLRASSVDAQAASALRAENQVLKKQLADLKSSRPAAPKTPDSS